MQSAGSAKPLRPQRGVAERTLAGMAWAYGSYVGGRLLVLLATAILARLLHPADFGLVALALTFTAFLEIVRNIGPNQWIVIVDEAEVDEWADTVWVVNVGVGLTLTLASVALGPAAASLFHQPKLELILPLLGANFFIGSLSYVHYSLAQKRMNFRARTGAEITEVITRGLVGVGLALAGAGVWSLVIGYVAGTTAMSIALWIAVPWHPRLRVHRAHLRPLLRFGGALTGVAVMAAMLAQFDNIVIGRILGSAALGLYVLATRLPELLIINLSVVAGEVLFPAFASIERARMARPFITSLHYTLVVALPMTAFLGILARPLILAAFGPRWGGAVTAMQVLSLYALVSPISLVCGTAYKALGRAALLLRLAVVQVGLLVPLVLILVSHGIVAVAGAQAAVAAAMVIVSLVTMVRLLEVDWRELARAAWPPVLAAALLAAVLWVIERTVAGTWPTLIVGGVVGGAVYVALLWLWARPTLTRLVGIIRGTRAPPATDAPSGAPAARRGR